MKLKIAGATLLFAAAVAALAAPPVMEPGKKGNALRFEGSPYGMYGKTSEFAIDDAVSVSMWIKPDAWKHQEGLVNGIITI